MKTTKSEHAVVAIIPARAGSKGIPNKNVRLLGGHPLVYYAIKNALDSKGYVNILVEFVKSVVGDTTYQIC